MHTRNKPGIVAVFAAILVTAGTAACRPALQGSAPVSPSATPTVAPTMPTVSVSPPRPTPSASSTHPPRSTPPARTPAPTGSPTSGGSEQTLTGTAYQGAQPGCIGLQVGSSTYELTGSPTRKLGDAGGYGQQLGRIRVVGHLAPPMLASHCMMGRMFVVDSLTRL